MNKQFEIRVVLLGVGPDPDEFIRLVKELPGVLEVEWLKATWLEKENEKD